MFISQISVAPTGDEFGGGEGEAGREVVGLGVKRLRVQVGLSHTKLTDQVVLEHPPILTSAHF